MDVRDEPPALMEPGRTRRKQPPGVWRRTGAFVSRHGQVNWALADQAVVSGANFLLTLLVARFLGPEEFGRFALAWLGLFFAQNLQVALMLSPLMTIGAKIRRDERPAYAGAALAQMAAIAIVTAAIVLAAVYLAGIVVPAWGLAELAVPVALAVLAGQVAEFFRRYYFTFGRPVLSFAVDAVRYAGQTLLLIGLFAFAPAQTGIATLFHVMAVAALAGAVVGAPAVGALRFEPAELRRFTLRHWRFSRWLLPNAFAIWAREYVVYVAVGAVVGLAGVGALRAAQQLVTVVNVPLHAFCNVVPMRAGTAFAEGGFAGLATFVRTFVFRYKASIALVLVAIAAAGEFLMTAVYGADYAGNGYLVAGFALVMLVYLLRNTVSIVLHAMETTVYEFFASIAGTVAVCAAVWPLVLGYGTGGAIAAQVLFELVGLLVLCLGLRESNRQRAEARQA